MQGNMPNVPVHDLLVHPREHDLVVGTYGRAMYITDVSVLQQVTDAVLAEDIHLFDIEPRGAFQASGWGNYDFYGDRHITTPNEPNAITISYYLRDTQERKVSVTIADLSNRLLRTITATSLQGLNTVPWDMKDSAGKAQPRGDYLVTVEIDGRTFAKTARVRHPG
jgi:hypothetical protein